MISLVLVGFSAAGYKRTKEGYDTVTVDTRWVYVKLESGSGMLFGFVGPVLVKQRARKTFQHHFSIASRSFEHSVGIWISRDTGLTVCLKYWHLMAAGGSLLALACITMTVRKAILKNR